MLCSSTVGGRTLQRKVQCMANFYSDRIRMKCWKRAIKENRQIKAKNEKPLRCYNVRVAY